MPTLAPNQSKLLSKLNDIAIYPNTLIALVSSMFLKSPSVKMTMRAIVMLMKVA
jgi:hypothetical protein